MSPLQDDLLGVRDRLKRAAEERGLAGRIARNLSPTLPAIVCVDVGASYYPHPRWKLFLQSPRTQWVAVDPNADNLSYTADWRWSCQLRTCAVGLSGTGGKRTLYVTNVDSGSSLLEPVIPESMRERITDRGYFFPVTERIIETLPLADVLTSTSEGAPVLVKLDTQGTELEILRGAEALIDAGRIVGVESEATLLAQPVMNGSGKFSELVEYLEAHGFELLEIDPVYAPSSLRTRRRGGHSWLNECNAAFALRPDVARARSVETRAAMLGMYVSYGMYGEAVSALDRDPELMKLLRSAGCDLRRLRLLLVGSRR